MQCPNCRSDNPAKAKFCGECGAPIGVPCVDCGFRNARDTKNCGGCGRSLAAAAAERRQITLLFADIVDSTKLAEILDPEDLRDFYASYQSLCAEIITNEHYEGYLAQYLGDGVLAYFGYPAAHEDDAARAVRSSLEILARAGGILVSGNKPRVRIGVHTGLVVVGDVGSGDHREQLALGEAPNIAARLQSEAQPDTIVISEATRRLLAGQFTLEDLGSRTLKGLSRPMQIFRVLGPSRAGGRFQAMKDAQRLTPFVGREREVEMIRAAWLEAVEGRGRTVLLRGEAGMGKSRLVEAAEQTASSWPHEVFQAECSPFQMNSPLNPIVEMLERRIGIVRDKGGANQLELVESFVAGRGMDLQTTVPLVAELLSISTAGRYPELDRSPLKLRQSIADLLLYSRGSPVLILIEDLHWADPSTLDVLEEIVTRQGDVPALMVCTTRPDSATPWSDRPNCLEIAVEALPPNESRTLVARIAGEKALPVAVHEEIVARTGGIPLFMEAVTRTVLESGMLRDAGDRYELTGSLPTRLIPTTVQDSLMGRIDRLGPDRPVAQLAATIGGECSFELLQAVLNQPTDVLGRSMKHLVELELVAESGSPPNSTYIFKHALIQDAAYESLLRKTRQEFHDKIAEVLTRRFPELAETKPELIARHHEGAGRTAEAIAGWMKAGVRAQQSMALRECVAYLQKAIALLSTLPDDDPERLRSEMEAQLTLGRALTATFGFSSTEVGAAFSRARDLCKRLDNDIGLVQSLFALSGMYFMRGILDEAEERARESLEMARALGNPAAHIGALHTIIFPTFYRGDFVQACKYGEEALPLYTPESERAVVAMQNISSSFFCAIVRSWALWYLGYPDQEEEARRQAWNIIETLNIPACTVSASGVMVLNHYLRRDYAAVARVAENVLNLSTESGYLYWIATTRFYRGWAWTMLGNPQAGLPEMSAGREGTRFISSGITMPQLSVMLAEAEWKAGSPNRALEAVGAGLARVGEYGEREHEAELHRLRGEILMERGDASGAEASLHSAIEVARSQQAKMFELRAALSLAKLHSGEGRTTEVRDLLRPLVEWFREGRDTPELRDARTLLASSERGVSFSRRGA
jgi:class 3 adenylate cyclase/predicted ATPase